MSNACAWFNVALRPQKPKGSLGRGAQDDHLDLSQTPTHWAFNKNNKSVISSESRSSVQQPPSCSFPLHLMSHNFQNRNKNRRKGGGAEKPAHCRCQHLAKQGPNTRNKTVNVLCRAGFCSVGTRASVAFYFNGSAK